MIISFDLDSVLFDIEPLYKQACLETGVKYVKPKYWAINECYGEDTTKRLFELFGDDKLYTMPIISKEYPKLLNQILNNPNIETFFVTQRFKQQPEKSYHQLRNAGIECRFNQVFDEKRPKVEVLKDIKTDLHFDDSPIVVGDCLKEGVNVAMISNNNTLYNHYLRNRVKHFENLKVALIKSGILSR